jgi:hypothetical protein
MPDRFATAVWVNPAVMRQCRTFFAKCDTPLLLLVLEVWRGSSAISQSAYPRSWTVAMTKGALFAIQGTHRQNGDFFDSINPIATKSRTSRHFRFGPKGDIRNDAAVTFIGTPLCRELS